MNKINPKKILVVFLVIFLMSRSRRIINSLSDMDPGGILTLEPLRNSPEETRYIVTLAVFLVFLVILWKTLLRKK